MAHELPLLPYEYDALEPYLDEQTLRIHHDKHHQGYVSGLNEAEDKLQQARQAGDFANIRALSDALAFNYSGHLFHSIYWTNMSPNGGGRPEGALAEQIEKDFASFDTFRSRFCRPRNIRIWPSGVLYR